jgi:hypothetical protein
MSFLPIVDRELRVRARRIATYRVRLWSSAIAIVLVGFVMATANVGSGGQVLHVLGGLVLAWSLLQGAYHTADCLSEEKRNGTMGLLFLTDLRGYDVVLGKLMAASLNSFYALLAVLPPLSIPLLLGGAMADEFWRLVLVLINALFLSLSIGLCASAATRLERAARGATLMVVAFFVVVLRLAQWIPSAHDLSLFSPSLTFHLVFDSQYRTQASSYWLSLLLTHLLAWSFLLLACGILPRAWQDVPERPRRARGVPWPSALPRPPRSRRDYERVRLLAERPVIWLASRHQGQQFYLWALTGGTSVAIVLMWITGSGSIAGSGSLAAALPIVFVALALHLALATWVASEATHSLAEARDSGALELLLATPLTTEEIIEGYFDALMRLFYRPVALLVVVEAALLCAQVAVMLAQGVSASSFGFWTAVTGLCLVIVVLDLFAAARFGLWKGLSAKKANRAFIQTVLYVLILPLLGCACFPVIGLIKNFIFINHGRQQLRAQFRTLVTERFSGDETSERQPRPRPAPPSLPPVLER